VTRHKRERVVNVPLNLFVSVTITVTVSIAETVTLNVTVKVDVIVTVTLTVTVYVREGLFTSWRIRNGLAVNKYSNSIVFLQEVDMSIS
jgi:hypothetical protein